MKCSSAGADALWSPSARHRRSVGRLAVACTAHNSIVSRTRLGAVCSTKLPNHRQRDEHCNDDKHGGNRRVQVMHAVVTLDAVITSEHPDAIEICLIAWSQLAAAEHIHCAFAKTRIPVVRESFSLNLLNTSTYKIISRS